MTESGEGRSGLDIAPDEAVTVADVLRLRAMFRQADPDARSVARRWLAAMCDLPRSLDIAPTVLRSATIAYPTLVGDRRDPAEDLLALLGDHPRLASVSDIETTYLLGAVNVRRTLLELLAIRDDQEGLSSLAFLLGGDGPAGLLPSTPTAGLMAAVSRALDRIAPGSTSMVVDAVCHVLDRPGWTIPVARFLREETRAERLDDADRATVMIAAGRVFSDLIDACDRVAVASSELHDLARPDRSRLVSILWLLGTFGGLDATLCLWRALSSPDPRVAALAAVVLIANDETVGEDRLQLIARDPHARADLMTGLASIGLEHFLPGAFATPVASAEADLVRWLAEESEIGAAPDEIEHIGPLGLSGSDPDAMAHLFRFRLRAPHWSAWRGWMVGAAGPYESDGRRRAGAEHLVRSLLLTEDADTPEGHLRSIETTTVD